ncbi:endonuclease 8-like 1 [Rhincodon typus]|uniref:endonuclease 8-like 1 n=1 Tax=Rhincodon typus TaxID=259920 RepID=UPI0009A2FBE8|nr:endonuclease 8-like 1 [Rhincodon typus]XP_048473074.1 endonuclease 8-like 1 [Rhincodon typus]XP_048473075.1 endonuclease 8-like 1 [Rhincodon typus]XP_048473076.1 endonuclease 8-like 1 [Rhincodon typus]
MPEGPEIHLAARFVNQACSGTVFSGQVEKSVVSKNCDVPFECDAYLISAVSRGKEVKLTLAPIKEEDGKEGITPNGVEREDGLPAPMDVVFRFGMSGSFKLTTEEDIPKHAHLKFFTKQEPRQVLCFVDPRRFGSWEVNGIWQPDRGPCVMLEYERFRSNVLTNLSDRAFDKPICEVLLNQKYFNGIGNYLRAEILFRSKVPPFEKARTVLEPLLHKETTNELPLSKKIKIKMENPDLLELCHMLPMEVINLGGKGYDPEHVGEPSAFEDWLQCYYVDGMQLLRDSNGRTIWFQGNPGPMAPKGSKTPKPKSWGRKKTDGNGKKTSTSEDSDSSKGKVKSEQRKTRKVPTDRSQRRGRSSRVDRGQAAEMVEAGKGTRKMAARRGKKSVAKPSPPTEAVTDSESLNKQQMKSRTKSRKRATNALVKSESLD